MIESGVAGDCYQLHRLALAPLLPAATGRTLATAARGAVRSGEPNFQDFLLEQGLAPLWDAAIGPHQVGLPLSTGLVERLRQARRRVAGHYLIQRERLCQIRDTLDRAGISHVTFKGADTRERYYEDPALRPAADIDILVAPQDRIAAIKALRRQGFAFHADPKNISHEASLVKKSTAIDLHWDIMRPGRTRVPMVASLLATRLDCGRHWGISDEGNLFVMLVHPVFTKYATAPQASLVRLLDLVYLLGTRAPDWDRVCSWLAATGLKTGGWISLSWLHLLTGIEAEQAVRRRLQPGRLRVRYLQHWLEQNWPGRLLDHPLLVRAGFTLAAHDRPADVFAAVKGQRQGTRDGLARCLELQALS